MFTPSKKPTPSASAALIAAALALGCGSVAAIDRQPTTLAARDSTRVQMEQLPEQQLKLLYLGCSNAALDRVLGGSEAAFCSIAYDVLLQRHFAGNFHAFLSWSRSRESRPVPSSEPSGRSAPAATLAPLP
jgi:hypothetical protein